MTSSPDLPLGLLLERAGAELLAQADAVRSLHDLAVGMGSAADTIRQAQAIDVSSQHLDEIAALLSRIASMVPLDWMVPGQILDPLVLSALRDRLAGARHTAPDAGDVDFF